MPPGQPVPAFVADIVFGILNWPSVAVTTNVIKKIVEHRMAMKVGVRTGTPEELVPKPADDHVREFMRNKHNFINILHKDTRPLAARVQPRALSDFRALAHLR